MKKVVLLSDTHSHFDDKMLKFCDNTNEIWHAGDIGSLEIADKLRNIGLLRAVYGNIDNHEIRLEFKKQAFFTIDEFPVFMTHIGGYPDKYAPGIRNQILELRPKLFISGHSHILKVIFDKKLDCLHINPGACGISGLHLMRTMVRFCIDGDQIRNLEIWELKR